MPDPVAPPSPPAWYSELPEPVRAHITNRGHDKEEPAVAAAKLAEAHFAAQKLIGVPPEQVVRLPKDPTDPGYLEAYNRVAQFGAPKDGYKFDDVKFKDGTALAPEIAKAVNDVAAELHLPAHAATRIAQSLVTLAETDAAADATERATAVAAMQATMRANWGANYDLNMFKVSKVAETLGWDKSVIDGLQTQVGGDKLLGALVALGDKMGEAPMHRGETGGGPTNMTRDQAVIRKAEIMTDAQTRKFTDAEMAAAQRELIQLATIIQGPPPR